MPKQRHSQGPAENESGEQLPRVGTCPAQQTHQAQTCAGGLKCGSPTSFLISKLLGQVSLVCPMAAPQGSSDQQVGKTLGPAYGQGVRNSHKAGRGDVPTMTLEAQLWNPGLTLTCHRSPLLQWNPHCHSRLQPNPQLQTQGCWLFPHPVGSSQPGAPS